MDSNTGENYRNQNISQSFTTATAEKSSNSLPDIDAHNGNDVVPQKQRISESSAFSDDTEYTFEHGVFEKRKGLSWPITGLFVVGDMAGGGLVALPTATIQLGIVFGMIFLVVMNLLTMITSFMLGASWNILLRRWPEYRSHCRKPYPEIAYRAMGPLCKTIVSVCIDVTQFGIAVVYLLLSAKNIHDAVKAFSNTEISFCYVVVVVAVCLLPILFLKSPQDFWWAVVLAMFTTAAAIIFILIGASIDHRVCGDVVMQPTPKWTNYFLGLGTLLFSYGGHSAFPTIQHDMRRPADFSKSTVVAFTILLLMYAPVCIMGYITYGNSLRDSVINSIQTRWIQQSVNLLITVHCILTLTIVFNPINQEAEEILHVPHHFGIKRVLVRTGMMVAVTFVALSLPNFGPLLDLMGGTTLALTSLILPPLFYVFLLAGEKYADTLKTARGYEEVTEYKPLTWRQMIKAAPPSILILSAVIISVGFIGGAAATYSAITELSGNNFKTPCYIMPFRNTTVEKSEATNCCGPYQNMTINEYVTCSAPDVEFYGKRNDL